MMRNIPWWGLVVGLVLLGVGGSARAQDPASARREIAAAYERISQAFRRQDVDGMMAFATADFTVKTPNGRTLTRQQARDNLQQNLDNIRAVRENRYTFGKLTLKGDTAIVPVTERFAVAFNDTRGEFGPVGKTHEVAGTTTYRDTWVRQDGQWKMRRSEMRAPKMTINGRPYRPSRTRPATR